MIHVVSNFGFAGMAAWVVKKHLGKMFCTPFIPLDGNYVKCLNACEPIVFHIPNGKKAQLLFLRPTDGLSSFDFLYKSLYLSYKEDKQQQINFHCGCKVKDFAVMGNSLIGRTSVFNGKSGFKSRLSNEL